MRSLEEIRAEQRAAERAARSLRQMGLAKGLRQWIAMTAVGAVKKAQQAMRYLRNQNLARGLSQERLLRRIARLRQHDGRARAEREGGTMIISEKSFDTSIPSVMYAITRLTTSRFFT